MTCFQKVDGWAVCKPHCAPGPDPVDMTHSPWSCEALGPRTPGIVPRDYWGAQWPAPWVAKHCASIGENCNTSRCCADTGMACFLKAPGWASCKIECAPGLDLTDLSQQPWSCKQLGNPTPGPPKPAHVNAQKAAPWVKEACAASGGESCLYSRCCSEPGTACFMKNAHYAGCLETCEPGPSLFDVDSSPWNCTQLGPRTPGIPRASGPPADWVDDECTGEESDCSASRCCKGAGMKCYEKSKGWSACLRECAPGVHASDFNPMPWSCTPMGPRNPGRPKSKPSLFCWALSRSDGDEADLIKYQLKHRLSIFQCDEWSVFSDYAFNLGAGLVATPIGDLHAKKGKWGSWLNTMVFVKAWHAIYWSGKFRHYDFTVKCDPDAVFSPLRLRWRLADVDPDEPWSIQNNDLDKDVPILGPIEVISRAAMHLLYLNNHPSDSGTNRAACEDPWIDKSGEDGFISNCMKTLGVKLKNDEKMLVQDPGNCGRGVYVVYHPFKTVEKYERCRLQVTLD